MTEGAERQLISILVATMVDQSHELCKRPVGEGALIQASALLHHELVQPSPAAATLD